MPRQCPSPHSRSWECLTVLVLRQKTMICIFGNVDGIVRAYYCTKAPFAALGDASLFCCIFGIHDYDTTSMAL